MARTPDFVSVVIPSFDAGERLLQQLSAIDEQDFAGPFEVIVADNGSRDGSVDAAHAWLRRRARAEPEIQIIDAAAVRGPGAARNAGVRAARGQFIAFCDADDVVSESWLRKLVESASEADLVGGRLDGRRLNRESVRVCYDLTDPAKPHLGFLPIAAGANLGVWADVFAAIGGFVEHSRVSEDVALVWRAQLRGYVFAASSALVHKRLPSGRCDAANRFFRYGIGDAWLYRQFAVAGMPRRSRSETVTLWKQLARGFPGVPEPRRSGVWLIVLALSCGRVVGSARYRVLFT
jgi:glycosyltransferase involved in cell wall biosynthesis